jgi:hypothetical protein
LVLVLALVIALSTCIATYRGSDGGLLGRNRAYGSPPGSLSGLVGYRTTPRRSQFASLRPQGQAGKYARSMGMPEDEHRAERERLWRKFLNERCIEPDQRGRRAKRDGITSGSVASRTPSAFGTGCDGGNTGGRWPVRRPNGGTKWHCMIASTSRSEAGKRPTPPKASTIGPSTAYGRRGSGCGFSSYGRTDWNPRGRRGFGG